MLGQMDSYKEKEKKKNSGLFSHNVLLQKLQMY